MAMLVRKECMRWCTGAARSSLFVLGELSNATAKKQQQTAGSMTSLASRAYRALAGTSVGSSLGNTGVRCGAVAGSSHWAQSQSAGRASSWASYSTGTGNNLKTGDELLESMEHATGLELAEREGKARGVDIFTEGEAWLNAPFGTPEKPVVVTSSFSERIVGVTDPEDDSIVIWDFIREGEPPKQVVENGEYFVLKKIDNPEDHFKQHTWEMKKEDLERWMKEQEEREKTIEQLEKEFLEEGNKIAS
jgi:cytochrome c oxidase subunit 5b